MAAAASAKFFACFALGRTVCQSEKPRSPTHVKGVGHHEVDVHRRVTLAKDIELRCQYQVVTQLT